MKFKNSKLFYGVWIVAGIWLVYFLTAPPGSYATSIISTHIVEEFGWSESVIGYSTSLFYLVMALMSIPTSLLIRRRGIRFTIVIGSIIGILAYILIIAFMGVNQWLYIIAFAGIGASSSMCAIVTGSSTINLWYDRNKAIPMSIVLTAGAIGGFIMPVLVNELLKHSYVFCWAVFIGMNILAIIITFVILEDKPEDIGEIRDGHQWTIEHPMNTNEKRLSSTPEPSIKNCYHSAQFYNLSYQTFVSRAANAAITSYVIIYAIQSGISAAQAALLITVYNIASLFGRFIVGFIDKKINRRFVNAFSLCLMAVECLVLYLANGYGSFCLATAIGGFGFGSICTLFPLLVPNYFGKENFSLMFGTFTTIGTMGSFVAPMIVFAIAQVMGGYNFSYAFWGIVLIAAAVLALLSPVRQINDVRSYKKCL